MPYNYEKEQQKLDRGFKIFLTFTLTMSAFAIACFILWIATGMH